MPTDEKFTWGDGVVIEPPPKPKPEPRPQS